MGFLIMDEPDFEKSKDYYKLFEELDKLDEDAHVVQSWDEVLAVVYNGKSFPRSVRQKAFLNTGETLEKLEWEKELDKGRKKREKEQSFQL